MGHCQAQTGHCQAQTGPPVKPGDLITVKVGSNVRNFCIFVAFNVLTCLAAIRKEKLNKQREREGREIRNKERIKPNIEDEWIKIIALYSGVFKLKYWLGNQSCWLRIFIAFLSTSKKFFASVSLSNSSPQSVQ